MFIYLYINNAHSHHDVSQLSALARRLELPDSMAAAGPMSLNSSLTHQPAVRNPKVF